MKLKRLEMIGFKSFADKTVIEFQNGVTGIVGPNGSGKSNIADAIRWVLGEQRSRQLRGTNMQDVIFKGTQERAQLSYCEVSLVFDDASHIFNTGYDEIIITRKLYRSGDSEYLINKKVVRLKDITAILHDVGIGKDGYSIIGQNKVTEIVQSKPLDRRKIFEEAAGIAKFKSNRSESQSKLEKTKANMDILSNVMEEKQRRIDQLIPQANKTKKYIELRDKLKTVEINNYIYQYDNANSMKEAIQVKINSINGEISVRTRELNNINKKVNENTIAIEKIDNTNKRLYNKRTELLVAKEKNSGATDLLKEKQRAIKVDLERLSTERDSTSMQLQKDRDELKSTENEVNELKNKNQSLNTSMTTTATEYSEILSRLTESEVGSTNSQNEVMDTLTRLGDAKKDLAKLTTEEKSILEQNEARKQDLDDLNIKYAETISTSNRLKENLIELNKKNVELKKESQLLIENINKNNQELIILDRKLSDNLKNISALESQYKILSELERDLKGYNNGVASILKATKVANSDIKNHLVGVVANMLDVPTKYRTAIETALGSNIQNIIVENENDAEMLINFLKTNKYGQATFLPLTTVKPKHINKEDVKMFNVKGCYGVASDLISYDAKIEKAVKTLLGGILVCEDTHTAITIAKANNFNYRIVTLDGNQTSTSGAISGGSQRSNYSQLLGREKDLENLKNQLGELKIDDENKKRDRQILSEQITSNNIRLKKIQDLINELNINIAKIQETLDVTQNQANQQKTQIDNLTNLVSTTNKKLIDISNEISILKAHEENLSRNGNMATESMKFTQKQLEELKVEKDKFQEKISNYKVEISETTTKISVGEDNILKLKASITMLESNLSSLLESIRVKTFDKEEIESQIAELQNTKQYIEIESELKNVETKLQELEEYKKNLQYDNQNLDGSRNELSYKISNLNERKNQESINKAKVDADLENMENRVWEAYNLTYGNCQEYKIENYDVKKGLAEAQNYRRSLDSLGNVNLNAIEDLELEQKSYDEMKVQYDDLEQARQETLQIIDQLSNEMNTRFINEFNKINENFGTVFTELFGGGRAKLELRASETDDPLEQGVDIIAEPPGKKFANISLLSGGEQTLTAIAILFAILKLRDMPFVLLDEVEAALDEMNVGRFAKYLNRFAGSTQFIVITHRKPTMEQADRLCGVTIQNTVSIVVNIKLSEAIKIAEDDDKKSKKE